MLSHLQKKSPPLLYWAQAYKTNGISSVQSCFECLLLFPLVLFYSYFSCTSQALGRGYSGLNRKTHLDDTHSESSGEITASDSGRGGSEEDIRSHMANSHDTGTQVFLFTGFYISFCSTLDHCSFLCFVLVTWCKGDNYNSRVQQTRVVPLGHSVLHCTSYTPMLLHFHI